MKYLIVFILLGAQICQAQSWPVPIFPRGHSSEISNVKISQNSDWILSSDLDNNTIIWNTSNGSEFINFKTVNGKFSGFFNDTLVYNLFRENEINFYSIKSGKNVSKMRFDSKINSLFLFGDMLVIITNKIYYAVLNNIIREDFLELKMPNKNSTIVPLNSEEYFLSLDSSSAQLISRDLDSKEISLTPFQKKTILNAEKNIWRNQSLVSLNNGVIYILNFEDNKILNFESVLTSNYKYSDIHLSEDRLVASSTEGVFYFLDKKLELQTTRSTGLYSDLKFCLNENGSLISVGSDNIIATYDFNSFTLLNNFSGIPEVKLVTFSSNQEGFLTCLGNGVLRYDDFNPFGRHNALLIPGIYDILNVEEFEPTHLFSDDNNSCILLFERRKLISKKQNSKIYSLRWDFANGNYSIEELKCDNYKELTDISNARSSNFNPKYDIQLLSLKNNDVQILSDEKDTLILKFLSHHDLIYVKHKYYFADKSVSDKINFTFKNQIFDFQQFDPILNNPGYVFKDVKFISHEVRNVLELTYKKRIEKLNFDPLNQIQQNKLPEIYFELKEKNLTNNTVIPIRFSVNSSSQKSRFFMAVNGIPVNEFYNAIINQNQKYDCELQLVDGNNRIKVFAVDEFENVSFSRVFNIYCSAENTQNLYFLSLGVSDYDNDAFDLQYPTKDATELLSLSEHKFKAFDNIYTKAILNPNGAGILDSINAFLGSAKTNDVIFLFYAGHGVLDNEFNYYLCPKDIDFNNPKEKGLDFNRLEATLAKLESRNRIIILDACHSGEVDKDEVAMTSTQTTEEESNLSFRNSGVAPALQLSGISIFELSRALFIDTRTNSGNLIFASSSGLEFSMESEKWKNGLFTFYLKDGFEKNKADLNFDGHITLHEWFYYASSKVQLVSNGKQNPTIRVDNKFVDPILN